MIAEEDYLPIAEHLGKHMPNVQVGQSQLHLTVEASQISETNQAEIDDLIQEMTETIRFKISNDAYNLKTKQEIKELLGRIIKIMA